MSTTIPTAPSELRDLADQHMAASKRFTRAYVDRDFTVYSQAQLMRLQNANYEIAMQLRAIAAALEG